MGLYLLMLHEYILQVLILPVYSTLQVGPDWEQVIDKISRGRYLPLLLVYGDHDDVHPAQSHEPLTRVSVKGSGPASTNRGQSEIYANRRGMITTTTVL